MLAVSDMQFIVEYGVVSQMPVLGDITNPLAEHNDTRAKPDVTNVGHYQSFLGSGITVDLAATERAGFYQYTFPDTKDTKNIIVDVSHVLSSYRGMGLQQEYLGGNIQVVNGNSSDGHYQGYGSYNNVRTLGLSRGWLGRPHADLLLRDGTELQSGPSTSVVTSSRLLHPTRRSLGKATPTAHLLPIPRATM